MHVRIHTPVLTHVQSCIHSEYPDTIAIDGPAAGGSCYCQERCEEMECTGQTIITAADVELGQCAIGGGGGGSGFTFPAFEDLDTDGDLCISATEAGCPCGSPDGSFSQEECDGCRSGHSTIAGGDDCISPEDWEAYFQGQIQASTGGSGEDGSCEADVMTDIRMS